MQLHTLRRALTPICREHLVCCLCDKIHYMQKQLNNVIRFKTLMEKKKKSFPITKVCKINFLTVTATTHSLRFAKKPKH